MPTHGDYTVSILVNGRPLQEYDTDGNHGHSADQVKYVEAIEGAEFSIQACIYMDGVHISYLSVRRDDASHRSPTHGWSNKKDGKHCSVNGQTMKQNFQFARLLTTEEKGDFEEYQRLAQSAGSIRIEVYDMTTTRTSVSLIEESKSIPIPEKALKGRPIDMSAGLGQARPGRAATHMTLLTPVGEKLASFVFLYRSRRSLQMLDIIPTTPEPESEPEPEPELVQQQDPNSLSLEDARRLVSHYQEKERRMLTVKDEHTKVKDEHKQDIQTPRKRSYVNDDDDDDECQIVSVKKAKPFSAGKVVVLDLT